jgi:hypothetical protein
MTKDQSRQLIIKQWKQWKPDPNKGTYQEKLEFYDWLVDTHPELLKWKIRSGMNRWQDVQGWLNERITATVESKRKKEATGMETKLEAGTQYGDMKGTVAIDWHDIVQFSEFLKGHGIDTSRFLPENSGDTIAISHDARLRRRRVRDEMRLPRLFDSEYTDHA